MGVNFGRKIFCVCGLFILLGCKKNDNNISTVPPTDSTQSKPVPSSFAKGADISWLTQMESSGYSFYDSTGAKNGLHASY